jgi:hypothetical protein
MFCQPSPIAIDDSRFPSGGSLHLVDVQKKQFFYLLLPSDLLPPEAQG